MNVLVDAVKTLLETNVNGYEIGDAEAPPDDSLPYAVLYPLDDTLRDGDYVDTQRTSWYEFQITVVGETREQSGGFADELRALLLAANLTPAGFSMYPFKKVVDTATERDDDVKPSVFYTIVIVTAFTAPTS